MNRKLVAALACRSGGTRLYGKPLQNLVKGTTILDQILSTLDRFDFIETSVLGISEGVENFVFADIARQKNLPYIFGDEIDVLSRLIQCARVARATDVFRITTECPFLYFDVLKKAWQAHVNNHNDVTTVDNLPEGTHFEIYTTDALEQSHERGHAYHRSEGCSRYIREHREDFRVEVLEPDDACKRPDIRLTVDYPEDLVVCRRIYEHFESRAPLIPLSDIIAFLDERANLKNLLAPYVSTERLWPEHVEVV